MFLAGNNGKIKDEARTMDEMREAKGWEWMWSLNL
jgi:hypothetical protein